MCFKIELVVVVRVLLFKLVVCVSVFLVDEIVVGKLVISLSLVWLISKLVICFGFILVFCVLIRV